MVQAGVVELLCLIQNVVQGQCFGFMCWQKDVQSLVVFLVWRWKVSSVLQAHIIVPTAFESPLHLLALVVQSLQQTSALMQRARHSHRCIDSAVLIALT